MKNYIAVFFCLIVSYGFSQDCTYTLQGKIIDFHDGSIIEGATVHIKNTRRYTATNAKGNFRFSNLCKGVFTLVISHIGCKTIEENINLKANYSGKFTLEHHSEELEEVTVVGNITSKKTNSLSETKVLNKTIENYSSGSLGDVLKEVPGVSSLNTGNAIVKPMINGLHSSRIVVMNNGVRLQDQEWGIEHAPNVDINSAESISVIKGAGALAYASDAIGGVIVLNPKKIIKIDSLFGKTITGFQNNGRGYNIATSLSKTYESEYYINTNASYKRFGDYKAPGYFLTNTGSKSVAFSIDAGYKTFEKGWSIFLSHVSNEIGILRAAHTGNEDDFNDAIGRPEPLIQDPFSYQIDNPKQEITHWTAKVSYFKRFENLGKLSLQYDYQHNQRFEFDRRRGSLRAVPALDLKLQTHSITTDFLFDSNNKWKVKTGGLFRFQDNFANPDTGVRRFIPDYQKIDIGVYFTSNYKLNDVTELDLGVRYDFNYYDVKKFYRISRWEDLGYDDLFSDLIIGQASSQYLINAKLDFHNIAVSTGMKWNVSDNNTILFNYTLSKRPPNIAELFSDGLHHGSARIELGDLTLNSETSHRFSTTYKGENRFINWQLDTYLNLIDDYIYLIPGGREQTIRGFFPVWNYKQTDALLLGFDASVKVMLSDRWSYGLKSFYIYAEDKQNGSGIIDMPPFQIRNSISYSNPKWNNFSSTLISEFVARQTRYPLVLEDQLLPPPDSYHLLHLKNSVEFNGFKNTQMQLSFNINNLLNKSYRDYLNRLRFFADELGRNFQIQLKINY